MPASHSLSGRHTRLSNGEDGGDGADCSTWARMLLGIFLMHRLRFSAVSGNRADGTGLPVPPLPSLLKTRSLPPSPDLLRKHPGHPGSVPV